MTRRLGRVVAKVLILFLCLGQQLPGYCQSAAEFNQVVSVVEDASGNLVLINTSKKTHIAAPVVQYLPGSDVGTVLVADFPGLLWREPSRTITPRQRWIKSIHIGQFQDNPPVLRIAVRTDEPKLLRNLAFRSSPGVLVVKWAAATGAHALRTEAGSGEVSTARAIAKPVSAPIRSAMPSAVKTGVNRPVALGGAPVRVDLWPSVTAGQSEQSRALGIKLSQAAHEAQPVQKMPSVSQQVSPGRTLPATGQSATARPAVKPDEPVAGQPVIDGAAAISSSVAQLRGEIPVDGAAVAPPVAPPRSRQAPFKAAGVNELPGRAAAMPPAAPTAASRNLSSSVVQKSGAKVAESISKDETAGQLSELPNQTRQSGKLISSLKRLFGPAKERAETTEKSSTKPNVSPSKAASVNADCSAKVASSNKEPQSNAGATASNPVISRPAGPPVAARPPSTRNVTAPLADSKDDSGLRQPVTAAEVGSARSTDGNAIFEARGSSAALAAGDVNARSLAADSADAGLPKVTVSGSSPVKLELESDKPLSYKSFRLHNPERYVVDIQSGADLRRVSVPPMEQNGFLQSIRVGSPDSDAGLSRLVLDLSAADVEVADSTDESKRVLSLLIGKLALPAPIGRAPAGQTVVLDAGHGGSDPGAQRGDIQEKEITLQIAAKVKKLLEGSGVKVIMTRSEDTAVSLEERVVLTNNVQPDVFLSVHINSLETNSTIHGIETYYQTDQSRPLAQLIHSQLVGKLEAPDRNVRKARFYVINHTPVPAVLAEVGFISNKEERTKLISTDYQNQVANALVQGVILYLSQRNDLAAAATTKGKPGTTRTASESQDSANRPAASLAQSGAAAPKTAR